MKNIVTINILYEKKALNQLWDYTPNHVIIYNF